MKELRIVALDGIWCAEHLEDGLPDGEILDLFDGEYVLPTPFMTSVKVEEVMAKVRRLNPKCRVTTERTEVRGGDSMPGLQDSSRHSGLNREATESWKV